MLLDFLLFSLLLLFIFIPNTIIIYAIVVAATFIGASCFLSMLLGLCSEGFIDLSNFL